MYKDKKKSNEAAKERMRRYRVKKGVTESGRNKKGVTCFDDLPVDVQRTIESMASSPEDKQARTERAIRYQRMFPSPHSKGLTTTINPHLPPDYKTADQLASGEFNKVSKPGDLDYEAGEGRCRTCGAITQTESITKCHQCVSELSKAVDMIMALPDPA